MNTLILDSLPPITAEKPIEETDFSFLERRNTWHSGIEIVVDHQQMQELVELLQGDDEIGMWQAAEGKIDCIKRSNDMPQEDMWPIHDLFVRQMQADIQSAPTLRRLELLVPKMKAFDAEMRLHNFHCNTFGELKGEYDLRLQKFLAAFAPKPRMTPTQAIAQGVFERVEVGGFVKFVKKEVNVQKEQVYG